MAGRMCRQECTHIHQEIEGRGTIFPLDSAFVSSVDFSPQGDGNDIGSAGIEGVGNSDSRLFEYNLYLKAIYRRQI
eukprot:scaffold44519_cov214-Amphora_coffeaeformis.AAC.2